MIGAIEILIIVVIFGIIFGRDAIDKTFRKHADEGVVESVAEDFKDYYKENPKRMVIVIASSVGALTFLVVLLYWAFTRTDLPRMLGLE